ncbi:MAG: NAD(+) synthase [Peptostreptococcaceae bacterium]|nr:NAD(+) synthase [Peptostreptococcaceae bacterium]
MRNYKEELIKRIAYIRNLLETSGAEGIVYGNSGGKDSALAGILSKMACDNTLGVMMPCQSKRNYEEDTVDAIEVAEQFDIETITVDLTKLKNTFEKTLLDIETTAKALTNVNPRLRMTTLYAVAQSKNLLVCGTGNRSEGYMGYFTKWGDGAFDFNPIGDLTVGEIYDFLKFLNAPKSIIEKAPSAALFEGQTDEKEMGITYKEIDNYILNGVATPEGLEIIERYHNASIHKRESLKIYGE